MDGYSNTDRREHQREAAAYVADITADLARMARRNGLDALGYLLDMARLEARSAMGQFEAENLPS
jgi:hypothetical protein